MHLLVAGLVLDTRHVDRSTDHRMNGSAMRHEADVVVENAATPDDRQREREHLLELVLHSLEEPVVGHDHAVVDLVLAEAEHGHERRARLKREAHEAFARAQHHSVASGQRLKRLGRSAH